MKKTKKTAMRKRRTTTFLSCAMAIMLLVSVLLPLAAFAESQEDSYVDYTPFVLEYDNGAIYNQQTADMAYKFYRKAESYIDKNAKPDMTSVADEKFTFTYNDTDYSLSSVYIHKPDWVPSCGLLVGVLNYNFNGEDKHIMMVMFRGTDNENRFFSDWGTNIAFIPEYITGRGYHSGFFATAIKHYDSLCDKKFSLGNETVTFSEYIEKMNKDGNDYQMLVTGHSLGGAVANIFTSYFIDGIGGKNAQKNAVAYTFASPLTCPKKTANSSNVKNVFNFINKHDIVPDIGGADREGVDLRFSKDAGGLLDNHNMKKAYSTILEKANANIYKTSVYSRNTFVLYNNFDNKTNTYQRIIYKKGALIVEGNGVLAGDWRDNTFIDFSLVSNKCTSLIFDSECTITAIGDHAFSGMSQLTNELVLPDTIRNIGDYAFSGCSGLAGDLIFKKGTVVGMYAFSGCSSLTSIDAQHLEIIKYGAFLNSVQTGNIKLTEPKPSTYTFENYYLENKFGYTTEISTETINHTSPGYKIHLGIMSYNDLLQNPTKDYYYFLLNSDIDLDNATADIIKNNAKSSIPGVAEVSPEGVISVLDSCPDGEMFTVILVERVNGKPYFESIDIDENAKTNAVRFFVSNYENGLGTEKHPYLIENYDQLKNISKDLTAHYKLVCDIDCTSKDNWESLAPDASNPFTGSLNGNGYTIKGLTGNSLFAYNKGTISNLTIEKASITKTSTNGIEGILVAQNESGGTIENCHITNDSEMEVTYKYNQDYCYLVMGGIAGNNFGTISHSSVTDTKLTGHAKGGDGHYNVYCNIGGIAGRNQLDAQIKSCAAYDVTIYGTIYHNGIGGLLYKDNKSYAYFRLGGFVGVNNGDIIASYYNNPTPTCKRTYWDHDTVDDSEYAILKERYLKQGIALIHSGIIDCEENESKTIEKLKNPDLTLVSKPNKSHYYIGEKFNVYGLKIVDENNKEINEYTISGYDPYKSGEQTISVFYQEVNASEPSKIDFTITVENILPTSIVITPRVNNTEDDAFDINTTLTLKDLKAVIYYNNGDKKEIEDLSENELNLIFEIAEGYLLSETGDHVAKVNCYYSYFDEEGNYVITNTPIASSVVVLVVCDCTNTSLVNTVAATNSEYGYTGDRKCNVCGNITEEGTLINKIPCNNHTQGELFDVTLATHTTSGEASYICTVCDTKITIVIPADTLAHTFGAWESYSETQHKQTCECGAIKYETHTWNEEITIPATHTTKGEKRLSCNVCGFTKTEVIPADTSAHTFGAWEKHSNTEHKSLCECGAVNYETHTWNEGVIATSPTHTAEGTLLFTCEVCKDTKTEAIPPEIFDHTFGAWEHYSETQHKRSCICGAVQLNNHLWDTGTITTPATHKSEGVKTYSCKHCSATRTESVPRIEHVFDKQVVLSKYLKESATCTTSAVYYYSCSCGEIGEKTFTYGSARSHSFTVYTYDNNATCESDGTETAQCNRCSAINTRIKTGSMLSHVWGSDWILTEKGHYRICNDCDATTPIENHISGGPATESSAELCVDCGYTIAEKLNHVHRLSYTAKIEATCTQSGNVAYYTCSGCQKMFSDANAENELFYVKTPALDHHYLTTVVSPTCYDKGYNINICSRCNDTYVDCYTKAKGHSFSYYKPNNDATYTEDGTKTAKCDRCSETHTKVDTGSALGMAQKFRDEVAAIELSDEMRADYVQLSSVMKLYSSLSDTEKASVTAEYEELLSIIKAYNSKAQTANQELANATEIAFAPLAFTGFTFISMLWFLLKKKFFI